MGGQETADPSAVPVSEGKKAKKARPRGQVTIFGTWCKGCGICIEFCPQGVLEANGQGRPKVVRPERCTACQWCEGHCPDMAIVVRRLEPAEVEELEEQERLAGPGEPGDPPAGGEP
jgi:2-oxoglutarate ferredoxin oxidoreductase subunit delta